MWCKFGKVIKPDSATEHWKTQDLEGGGKVILVEVETMPDGCDLTCRLSSGFSSGGGNGAWAIPRLGSIVGVAVPDGEIEFMPIVFGVLDCNAPPDGLDETLSLIVDDRTLAVRVPKFQMGDSDAGQAFIKGTDRRQHETSLTTALTTFLTAVETYAGAIAGIADPSGSATTTLTGAITTMSTAITTYESQAQQDLSTIVFGK
jgi:hypothetical protein